jgi:hypothetical protein
MFSSKNFTQSGYSLGLAALVWMVAAGTGRAQWYVPESVGARGGFSMNGSRTADLTQGEAFVHWDLPWKLESESGWFLQTKLTLCGGFLGGNGKSSIEGTLAPAVAFGKRHFPLSVEGGAGPTYLSEQRFGSVNFGQELQFTSFIGLNLDLTSHWRLGYRFQHMSNAGLSKPNPGLNLNMFALSYVF